MKYIMKIPRYLWIRWLLWITVLTIAAVLVSLIDVKYFIAGSVSTIVLMVMAALIFSYEEKVLSKHLEAEFVGITKEEFEEAKRILLERGDYVVEGDDKHHTITNYSNEAEIEFERNVKMLMADGHTRDKAVVMAKHYNEARYKD